MTASFACVLYPSDIVSERALSRGFAVALAGFDVPTPSVLVSTLRGVPGWSVAFYRSGRKVPAFEELDHACELFEDELPPGLCVRDAAASDTVVYALVYSDEICHDDAWRFAERAILRRFVREGDDGLEAGQETLEESEAFDVELNDEGADSDVDAALKPHRGSTFLSEELGVAILPAVMGALFEADRRVAVRLVDPDAPSIEAEAKRLVEVLRRVPGRSELAWPTSCAGVSRPAQVEAFASVYDFHDPSDPSDLYREIAIGRIEGTLHFIRPSDMTTLDTDPRWVTAGKTGAFPIATLTSSALGGGRGPARVLGLSADGETLVLSDADRGVIDAGPTFGELLCYLALGFKQRDDIEEDLIGALMLRAKIRTC